MGGHIRSSRHPVHSSDGRHSGCKRAAESGAVGNDQQGIAKGTEEGKLQDRQQEGKLEEVLSKEFSCGDNPKSDILVHLDIPGFLLGGS